MGEEKIIMLVVRVLTYLGYVSKIYRLQSELECDGVSSGKGKGIVNQKLA